MNTVLFVNATIGFSENLFLVSFINLPSTGLILNGAETKFYMPACCGNDTILGVLFLQLPPHIPCKNDFGITEIFQE